MYTKVGSVKGNCQLVIILNLRLDQASTTNQYKVYSRMFLFLTLLIVELQPNITKFNERDEFDRGKSRDNLLFSSASGCQISQAKIYFLNKILIT